MRVGSMRQKVKLFAEHLEQKISATTQVIDDNRVDNNNRNENRIKEIKEEIMKNIYVRKAP